MKKFYPAFWRMPSPSIRAFRALIEASHNEGVLDPGMNSTDRLALQKQSLIWKEGQKYTLSHTGEQLADALRCPGDLGRWCPISELRHFEDRRRVLVADKKGVIEFVEWYDDGNWYTEDGDHQFFPVYFLFGAPA